MTPEEKFQIIKRLTQEIVKEDELKTLLKEKKHPVAYIGFAPTGRMHIGYLIPIFKITDFIKAGFKFKFLLANLHAYLDDEKTPWELLDARAEYYKECVLGALEAFGADTKDVEFVKGTDFELEKDYILNVLKMVGDVTLNRSKRAASEVVRFKEDPKLGGFIYPILQIEDVRGLNADLAFGGIDQRGIYMLGRELMEKFKRPKYVCVFTPLLPGLTGEKMSASDAASKIDLLDTDEELKAKVNKAHCIAGEAKENGVLAFAEYVIMPHLQNNKKTLQVKRPEKFGGSIEYPDYKSLEKDFIEKKLHPMDLKNAVAQCLIDLARPIKKRFEKKQELLKQAYP